MPLARLCPRGEPPAAVQQLAASCILNPPRQVPQTGLTAVIKLTG